MNAYHQIMIKEGDKWKIVFHIRYNHFKYQVMLFGLSNIQKNFQGYINKILAKKLDIFVIIYLDDIFINIKDLGQSHITAVRWALDVLRKNSLFAQLKKCCFHKDWV